MSDDELFFAEFMSEKILEHCEKFLLIVQGAIEKPDERYRFELEIEPNA